MLTAAAGEDARPLCMCICRGCSDRLTWGVVATGIGRDSGGRATNGFVDISIDCSPSRILDLEIASFAACGMGLR